MRLVRSLVLVTVMAFAALAASAATASATDPVEVHDETGSHCNPCDFEMHGESQFSHPLIGPIFTCEETLHGEVYEDGSGHFTELLNQDHLGTSCTTQMCNGVGEPQSEAEWSFQIEESVPGEEELAYVFCLESPSNPDGTGAHCAAHADVAGDGSHHYTIELQTPCPNGLVVSGQWEMEGTPIEVEHADA